MKHKHYKHKPYQEINIYQSPGLGFMFGKQFSTVRNNVYSIRTSD